MSAVMTATATVPATPWQLHVDRSRHETMLLHLTGHWTRDSRLPRATEVLNQATTDGHVAHVEFDCANLESWDSGFVIFLRTFLAEANRSLITCDLGGLPDGVRRLLALTAAVPERKDAGRQTKRPSALARIGIATVAACRAGVGLLAFLGEAFKSMLRLFVGKARFQRSELFLILQEVGAQALPIVSLISFLVGVILAYVGAIQLRQFGAQVYVADLVGIAMTREMGAMMAAIIMAGRTGAAFAAQLGTMQVNEEIDALSTLGIPPMDFLVLPRMLALALMMPLLGVYADLLGMIGGAVVGIGMLDLGPFEYYHRTIEAVGLDDFAAGVVKASVFGVLVAIAGCLRGMQCGRSSAAVGAAATSAVVTGIVFIIVSDAAMTVIFERLGF
jgi:phospholipid/cholesterol/gamma-HCH transport system permease protein